MTATWTEADGKLLVKTPYCEAVVEQCRKWGGKWDKAANGWLLPKTRLAAVRDLLGDPASGLVEVEVREKSESRPGYDVTDNSYHLGWHVLASRRGRDSAADLYADLVDGEIPESGGSTKYPLVNGKDCAFRLTVPADFASRLGLAVVSAAAPASPLAAFSDDDFRAEYARRFPEGRL